MLFVVGYAHAHVTSMDDTCTELARESWGIKGVKGYGRAPKLYSEYLVSTTNGPGLRGDFLSIVLHDLNPLPGR